MGKNIPLTIQSYNAKWIRKNIIFSLDPHHTPSKTYYSVYILYSWL